MTAYSFALPESPIQLEFTTPGLMLKIERYHLLVETEYSIIDPGSSTSINPIDELSPKQQSMLDQFISSAVTRIDVTDDSMLIIATKEETELRVRPDSDFEAWDLSGPGNSKILCLPGGELAIWDARN